MKKILKIILALFISFSFWFITNSSFAVDIGIEVNSSSSESNVEITNNWNSWTDRNDILDDFWNNEDGFFQSTTGWEKWIYLSLVRIAKDLKNLFFWLSSIYLMIIVVKVLFADNTEDEIDKFKKWIIWITIGIIVMQSAYAFTINLYNKDIWEKLAIDFMDNMIYPAIHLMEVLASVFFIAVAIFAFYRLVTSDGDEEKAKQWKMTIVYAIIWVIVIKFAKTIVTWVYGEIKDCNVSVFWVDIWTRCLDQHPDITWFAADMMQIINWMNGFIWLIVVIMIIYSWSQVLLSWGDEEKLNKAKKSLIYIAIWLFILAANWLILTFFITPEVTI